MGGHCGCLAWLAPHTQMTVLADFKEIGHIILQCFMTIKKINLGANNISRLKN